MTAASRVGTGPALAGWRPAAGQVALIEPEGDESPLTGVVMEVAPGRVVIDLGASPAPPGSSCDVVASFFSPDALYRVTARATAHDVARGVVELEPCRVERVQRRANPRLRVAFAVSLTAFDDEGPLLSVTGETIDIGPGGCRVATVKPFPLGPDPTITIRLPEGDPVVALGRVLEAQLSHEHNEYRLVFASISDADIERILRLLPE